MMWRWMMGHGMSDVGRWVMGCVMLDEGTWDKRV